jgi:hypothetical protein
MKDKNGITIKEGDIISYKNHKFNVLKYNGMLNPKMKGKLKIMERKSIFEGAIDDWLKNLLKYRKEIKIINK